MDMFYIGAIFLSLPCWVVLSETRSSYFALSFLKQPLKGFWSVADFKAGTEIVCALRCNANASCDETFFDRDSKQCLLYREKRNIYLDSQAVKNNRRSSVVRMVKVSSFFRKYLVYIKFA